MIKDGPHAEKTKSGAKVRFFHLNAKDYTLFKIYASLPCCCLQREEADTTVASANQNSPSSLRKISNMHNGATYLTNSRHTG
jgi:hypothetical protein